MSRLIDADALKSDIQDNYVFYGFRYLLNDFLDAIDKQPTVEPRKGMWMFSPDHAEGICTCCNYKIYGRPYQNTYLIVPYNFCPNCGASMVRGEEE